jgi:hypothetical protein
MPERRGRRTRKGHVIGYLCAATGETGMPHFDRIFGQYRATFESHSLAHAFPEVEAAMRAAYSPDRGYFVRAAKGKKEWCVLVHKGLTTGFRIDFVPIPAPFGTPEVEIRVHRSSRLLQLAYYLMAGLLCCAIAAYYLGNFVGWWAAEGLILLLVGALLSFAVVLTFPTLAGLCMYVGGRLSDDQLTAIGQTVGEVIERAGAVQRPGLRALAEPGAAPDRGGR